MPLPQFQQVEPEKVRADIRAIIQDEKYDQFTHKYPTILEDYVKIGVLMTDAQRCYDNLAVLNERLARKIQSEKVFTHESSPKGLQLARKKGEGEEGEVKHFGVLSGFFKVWEGMCGFNAAEPRLKEGKGLVPTLTQFVLPPDFRSHLLAPGYHWKDPGVGVGHGEFTHRIHWYIVIQQNISHGFLTNKPLDLFTMFADDLSVSPVGGKTIWDAVFDKVNVPDFRQAEKLHSWLKDEAQQEDPKVGVLAQLVAGRVAKRKHDKEKYTPEEGSETDWYINKLRQKEQAKKTTVVARSDKDRIVWHNPSDFHPSKKVVWTEDEMKG